jgi:DNA-directed RNA polymerase subunit RPC12/RpoP
VTVFVTYSCPACADSGRFEIDINLPVKDMFCPRCGHKIRAGTIEGGGEFRLIEASDGGRLPGVVVVSDAPLVDTRVTQLEDALRALLAAIDDPTGTDVGVELAAGEARAVLDG